MSQTVILYPAFAQALLTFLVMFWMGQQRLKSVARGEVKASEIAMRRGELPELAAKVSNNYHNQLEMPVLFYVLTGFIYMTGQVDIVLVSLAWAYVGIRYVHALVHTLVRSITKRFFLFCLSSLVLLVMWCLFAFRVVASGQLG